MPKRMRSEFTTPDFEKLLAFIEKLPAIDLPAGRMSFTPDKCVEWLEGRLPRPVDDLEQWKMDDE
jgi:hypothetical protein